MSNRKKLTTKIIKITITALWWIVLISLAVGLISIIGSKLRGEVPSIFGYSVMRIISGSMGETIPEGSYILIKRVSPEAISRGDIITFLSDEAQIRGMPNTHRVVEDPIVTDGDIEFVTRGDANPINDTVHARGSRLVGRYVKSLDGVTSFARMLDRGGLLVIAGALIVGFSLFACVSLCRELKKKPDGENQG